MHFITCKFASHTDSTTLADGDYQLIPEQEEVYSEDPGNNLTNPNPTSEGKPRT
jgi:hypothetical protein